MNVSLIIPSFIAGLFTFLAPCTFPLLPSYLSFITGVSVNDLQKESSSLKSRYTTILNGLFYVIGFSVVFISFGLVVGLGAHFLVQYRTWFSRIGGVFIIFFGLYVLGLYRLKVFTSFEKEYRLPIMKYLKPGKPLSAFLFGATFAFGWSPCVGPILGSVLLLSTSTNTLWQAGFLLSVFALGLAVPFLIVAATFDSVWRYLPATKPLLRVVNMIGGVFLVTMGLLLLTNQLGVWSGFFYKQFQIIDYNWLLDLL